MECGSEKVVQFGNAVIAYRYVAHLFPTLVSLCTVLPRLMETSSTIPTEPIRDEASDQDSAPPDIARSKIWFDDGNIVIQAENTQFRVYKGVLALQSDIFRDMFSVPQPSSDEGGLVEGCPVVIVHDTALDWTFVLEALLERRHISVPIKPIPFKVVAAFLRLGEKYSLETLKADATARLTYEFPSTLDAYDSMVDNTMVGGCDPVSVIQLARQTQSLRRVLPTAFYFVQDIKSITTKKLSAEDQAAFVSGWCKAVKAQQESTFVWLFQEKTEGCSTLTTCFSQRARRVFKRFTAAPSLEGLTKWSHWPQGIELCANCKVEAKKAHTEGRQKFWEMLPGFFGLPEWDELVKEN